jgi:hypothetical protein
MPAACTVVGDVVLALADLAGRAQRPRSCVGHLGVIRPADFGRSPEVRSAGPIP